ncbi:MAG: FAD:protein FMN transferase [Desulfocapsaceae bacterium]|nr:FAD:protein FMN transferase [Desulfocapsaceae bacterium]
MKPHPDSVVKRQALSRRKLLLIGGLAGGLGIAYYYGFMPGSGVQTIKHTQLLMGTIVNMRVCSEDEKAARNAIDGCIARMKELSDMMSTYVPESPLSRLNRDGVLENPPRELVEVFLMSSQLSKMTDGAFDPTVLPLLGRYRQVKETGILPPQAEIDELLQLVDYNHIVIEQNNTIRFTRPGTMVTLDGIAKGYIVDRGIDVLQENGFANAYIEAGGDLMTIGTRQDGTPWRIGIRNPRSDDLKKMETIRLSNRAIATSGDYLQYFTDDKKTHHIISPFTGFSPVETASSSIIAPTVAQADGLATATMVLGPRAAVELVETIPDCEGYFFDKELNKFKTTGFFS